MKQSVIRVIFASAIALICVGILLVGLYKTGSAANTPAITTPNEVNVVQETPATRSLNVVGDNAFAFGNTSDPWYKRYSRSHKSWSLESTNNVVTKTVNMDASGVMTGSIYTMGGIDSEDQKNADVWRYNPATNTWTRVDNEMSTPPPGGRAGGTFTGAPNGQFLSFGGATSGTSGANALWRYDPATGWWTTFNIDNPQGARDGHSAGVIGNKLYIVGGKLNDWKGFIQNVDLNGTMWNNQSITKTVEGTPTLRMDQATAFNNLGQEIYIFGGNPLAQPAAIAENVNAATVMTDSWKFSLSTGTWTRLPDLPQALTGALAVGWVVTSPVSTAGIGNGFEILIVGEQVTNSVETSYIFDGITYEQIDMPVKSNYYIYMPIIIRN